MGISYSPELKAALSGEVLEYMHGGMSLRESCRTLDLPIGSFLRWVTEDKALAELYAAAREALIAKMADEVISIADAPVGSLDNGATDSGAVAKQKLQVDARKWILSKIAHKQYGDKIENTLVGADGGPVKTNLTIEFVDAPKRGT